MDCGLQKYDLYVNDVLAIADIPFQETVKALERIVFRTGPYRNFVPVETVDGQPSGSGLLTEDLPGPDEKAPVCVYWIDDVKTWR